MNALEGRHNHPPACCCQGEFTDCPVCPEHGELAPGVDCPQCHQPIGRPHTEFCTLDPDRVWPDGQHPTGLHPLQPDCTAACWPEPPGHHLVASEAFIDQGDPRGPKPVDELVSELRDAVDRARERRIRGSQP